MPEGPHRHLTVLDLRDCIAFLLGVDHMDPYIAVGTVFAAIALAFLAALTGAPIMLVSVPFALSILVLASVHCLRVDVVIRHPSISM